MTGLAINSMMIVMLITLHDRNNINEALLLQSFSLYNNNVL